MSNSFRSSFSTVTSTLPKPTPFLPLPMISTALPSSSARFLDCLEDGLSERASMKQNLLEPLLVSSHKEEAWFCLLSPWASCALLLVGKFSEK